MVKEVTKMNEDINKMMDSLCNFNHERFMNMDQKEFENYRAAAKVVDSLMKVCEEQARMMEEMNMKIDKLLAKKEEK